MGREEGVRTGEGVGRGTLGDYGRRDGIPRDGEEEVRTRDRSRDRREEVQVRGVGGSGCADWTDGVDWADSVGLRRSGDSTVGAGRRILGPQIWADPPTPVPS